MPDEVGGLSVSFTAEASQLQSTLRSLEERLRAFDRAHGQQRVHLRAQIDMPGNRAMLDFRRDISRGMAQSGGVRIPISLAPPSRAEMDRLSATLGTSIKPVRMKVIGIFEWGQGPPSSITVPVTGGGRGGAPAAATPAAAPAAAARPPTRDEVQRSREEFRRRERLEREAAEEAARRTGGARGFLGGFQQHGGWTGLSGTRQVDVGARHTEGGLTMGALLEGSRPQALERAALSRAFTGGAGPAGRKQVSEAVYRIGGRDYRESEIPEAVRRSLSPEDLAAARTREAKFEAPPKATGPAAAGGLDPATLRRAGITGAFPEATRAQDILRSGQATLREAQGLSSVRAVGTTLAQQGATLFGGRPGRQEAAAELSKQLGIIRELTREGSKGGQAFKALADATDAHTTAAASGATDVKKYADAVDLARERARPYAEVLERAEARVGTLREQLKPGTAAITNFAASMAGSIAGMFLFQGVTGLISSAGEKLAPVLQELEDRTSGFQTNANRLRTSLAATVQQMHGFSDLAVASAAAETGMSRSTLELIRPTLSLDAAIEAGNKNLEQRIEFYRAFQGVQTRAGGLGALAGGVPAGVTQTQGGLNILGLQTPIGGTPSTFEQVGRQLQFASTPQVDVGKALGVGAPQAGQPSFDFARDIEDPVRDFLGGLAANSTANIPFVGDFFRSLDEQNEAIDAAIRGQGKLTAEQEAGANLMRSDFNSAVQRAGNSAVRLAEVTDASRAAQERQIAVLDQSGIPSLAEFAKGLRASRTVVEGAGEPGSTPESVQRFLQRVLSGGEAFAQGSAVPDAAVVAEQVAKPLAAALQLIDWQAVMQRGTILPGQTYVQGLASGRLNVGGGLRGSGIRELPPEVAQQAPNFERGQATLQALQQQMSSTAQTGRSQLITMLNDADKTMGRASSGAGSLTSQFMSLEQSLATNGAAMRGLQLENMWAQVNLQVAQYDEQIRVSSRSLADAISFQTGAGNGTLGLLQNQARQYEIQSAEIGFQQQALSLQSQSLGLQNAQLGIRSRELGFQTSQLQIQSRELGLQATSLQLAQRQRQINFQQALAGFAAPGATPEERAARIAEAEAEAAFAQKQQNIAVDQFSIERQIFDLEKQQLPIAAEQLSLDKQGVALQAQSIGLATQALAVSRAAFDVQQAMIDVQAARAIQDLSNQLDLLTQARSVTLQVAVNNESIAAYQDAIERDMAQINSILQQAYGVQQQVTQNAAALAAQYGGTIASWNNIIIGHLNEYLIRAREALMGFTGSGYGSQPPTGAGSGGGNSRPYASGWMGDVATPTRITVGEAGPETVAILRNPRSMTFNPQGGSGDGGTTIHIDIHDINMSGDQQDLERLASLVASRVEEKMGQRARSMGLGLSR